MGAFGAGLQPPRAVQRSSADGPNGDRRHWGNARTSDATLAAPVGVAIPGVTMRGRNPGSEVQADAEPRVVVPVVGAKFRLRFNGFVFIRYEGPDLIAAMRRALRLFEDRAAWRRLMANGFAGGLSWAITAMHYMNLFDRLIATKARGAR